MGSATFLKTTVGKHSLLLRLEMLSKSYISATSRNFSGPKLIIDGLMQSEKMCCGVMNLISYCFWKLWILCLKCCVKRTIQTGSRAKFKSQHL